jgi:hypothetical protein
MVVLAMWSFGTQEQKSAGFLSQRSKLSGGDWGSL